ncbi:MAG: hypothetical protein MHPSP_001386, partial [Paramarteilia canceri]
CKKALKVSNKNQLSMLGLMKIIKQNRIRYNRASELLDRNEDLKQAKKAFDEKKFEKEIS